MAEIEDGGPAFPNSRETAINSVTDMGGNDISSGMSRRDCFAGKALTSIGTWTPIDPKSPYFHAPDLKTDEAIQARAEWAYRQADAMLSARKGGA